MGCLYVSCPCSLSFILRKTSSLNEPSSPFDASSLANSFPPVPHPSGPLRLQRERSRKHVRWPYHHRPPHRPPFRSSLRSSPHTPPRPCSEGPHPHFGRDVHGPHLGDQGGQRGADRGGALCAGGEFVCVSRKEGRERGRRRRIADAFLVYLLKAARCGVGTSSGSDPST